MAVPGHERHQDVAAQRELATFGRRAVSDDLSGADLLAQLNQGPLVDGGVLIGAPELLHPIAVVLMQPRQWSLPHPGSVGARVDDDLVGGYPGDRAGPPGDDHRTRVPGHLLLQAGAHQRRLREEERHTLALHVRAHECAVRVIVLQERDQRRGDRDQLLGRHVHELDPVGRQERVVVSLPAQHQLVGEGSVLIEWRVGLRHRVVLLVTG